MHSCQTGSTGHTASYSMRTKRPVREADNSSPLNADVNNDLCVFIGYYLIKPGVNLTLLSPSLPHPPGLYFSMFPIIMLYTLSSISMHASYSVYDNFHQSVSVIIITIIIRGTP
jgi:hypothetical protein